jgi:hypothetical protein
VFLVCEVMPVPQVCSMWEDAAPFELTIGPLQPTFDEEMDRLATGHLSGARSSTAYN